MAAHLPPEVKQYHDALSPDDHAICLLLADELTTRLPEAEYKLWHGHPVWFLDGNPVAGYSKQKAGLRLMFWSGADFDEPALSVRGEKFKDASVLFKDASEIDVEDLRRWIGKARDIQWTTRTSSNAKAFWNG